jgi:hypothetical protein
MVLSCANSECNRGTGCGNTARPGLYRGRRATGVPTVRRDMIYTRCGKNELSIKLDGNNTRIVSGEIDDASILLDTINYHRINQ